MQIEVYFPGDFGFSAERRKKSVDHKTGIDIDIKLDKADLGLSITEIEAETIIIELCGALGHAVPATIEQ